MTQSSFRNFVLCLSLLCVSLNWAYVTRAQSVNVTGTWVGSSVAGGNTYPNRFDLIQNGATVTGTQVAGGATCTISGTVEGNTINMHNNCPSISYSSDSTATTDGKVMSGTFLDSQGTSGTFSATKSSLEPVLTPGTSIAEAPLVLVQNRSATFTLQKFSKISLSKLLARAKRAPKLTLQYELTISGKEKKKITSKRNVITAKNLKPGNYNASYKAVALKDGQKAFSSKASPKVSFTIN